MDCQWRVDGLVRTGHLLFRGRVCVTPLQVGRARFVTDDTPCWAQEGPEELWWYLYGRDHLPDNRGARIVRKEAEYVLMRGEASCTFPLTFILLFVSITNVLG